MQKRVNTSRVILGSTLEKESFCKKMQKNGWLLKKEEDKIGFFLRREIHLFFEHWIEIGEGEEYIDLSIAIIRDDFQFYKKRTLFRRKLNDLNATIAQRIEQGWQPAFRPYKKYRAKSSSICCSLHQIMVRKNV